MGGVIKTLNDRVVYVLQLIAENDYITFNDLSLLFGNDGTAHRYLGYLKNMGMVQEFLTKVKPAKAYCLTRTGWQILAQVGKVRVEKKFNISDYSYTRFPHQRACLQVGIVFRKHPWVADFKSSKVVLYELKQQQQTAFVKQWKQFDAEMVVKSPSRTYRVGIEVELTQKGTETYTRKFINIEVSRKVDFVCWLCGDGTILNKLVEIANSMQAKVSVSKHRFCLLDEFLQRRFETEWLACDGTKERLLPWPVEQSGLANNTQLVNKDGSDTVTH